MGSKSGARAPEPPRPETNLIDEVSPFGSVTFNPISTIRIPGRPDQQRFQRVTTLTPAGQRQFDQEQALNSALNQLALSQTQRIGGVLGQPLSFANLPRINAGQIQNSLSTAGLTGVRGLTNQSLPQLQALSSAGLLDIRGLSNEGLTDLPGVNDFGAERQRVEDALFQRQSALLNPRLEQEQRRLETQLASRGVAPGSAASRRALDDQARRSNEALAAARNDAILAGGQEQSRLFGNALQARGQQFGERQALTSADLATRAQLFGERSDISRDAQARRGQLFGERQAQSTFDLARRGQQFDERQAQGQFRNAAQQQLFGQQSSLRDRGISETLQLRNQPINEIAALLGAGGVTIPPQFAGSGDLQAANAAQQASQLAQFQQRQQGQQARLGGLFGLLGNLGSAGIFGAFR